MEQKEFEKHAAEWERRGQEFIRVRDALLAGEKGVDENTFHKAMDKCYEALNQIQLYTNINKEFSS